MITLFRKSIIYICFLLASVSVPRVAIAESIPKAVTRCHGNQIYHESKCRTPNSDDGKKCSSSKYCQSICAIKSLGETKDLSAIALKHDKTLGFCFGFVEYQDACTQYLDKVSDKVTTGICID